MLLPCQVLILRGERKPSLTFTFQPKPNILIALLDEFRIDRKVFDLNVVYYGQDVYCLAILETGISPDSYDERVHSIKSNPSFWQSDSFKIEDQIAEVPHGIEPRHLWRFGLILTEDEMDKGFEIVFVEQDKIVDSGSKKDLGLSRALRGIGTKL
jgi:hypothetical protein